MEAYTRANAGARIAYTTLRGTEALVNTSRVLSALKVAGQAAYGLSILVDATASIIDPEKQPWGKTAVNAAVGGAALLVGGGAGVTLGVGFLVLDKLGIGSGPSGYNNSYTPPSICMPDATNISR